jgi:simple sugar transport system substrate-binding protein
MKSIGAVALAVATTAVVATACTSGAKSSSAGAGGASGGPVDTGGKKVSFFVYTSPGTEFWSVVERGAKDAAKQYNIKLDIQYGDGDTTKYNNLIQTAVTNKVDGIAVSVPDNNAYTNSICRASSANVPLIAYNTNATAGKALDCEMGFVGQSFVDAGYAITKRMIADHRIGQGDLVFTPVELPEAAYAVQRYAGVKKALDEVGARAEIVGTGVESAQAQTKMVQYLLGHQHIKAIITLGGVPLSVSEAALKQARVKVPVGGFDPSPQAVTGIQDGTITALVDQQPYSQGYYAVAQLALYLKYKLYPSSIATGGKGLIDKSNVAELAKLTGTVR